MKTSKLVITMTDGEDVQALTQLSQRSGLSPSAVVRNLLRGVFARSWANCHATASDTFFCPELQQTNDKGEVLQGQELFRTLGQLALMEITQVLNLAQDKFYRIYRRQEKNVDVQHQHPLFGRSIFL